MKESIRAEILHTVVSTGEGQYVESLAILLIPIEAWGTIFVTKCY